MFKIQKCIPAGSDLLPPVLNYLRIILTDSLLLYRNIQIYPPSLIYKDIKL